MSIALWLSMCRVAVSVTLHNIALKPTTNLFMWSYIVRLRVGVHIVKNRYLYYLDVYRVRGTLFSVPVIYVALPTIS